MADANILLDAFNLKPAAAIDYIKRKGYKVSWNWFDTWKEAHATAFTVAKAFNADVLRDIRIAVEHAIENGETFETFKKKMMPQLQSKDEKRNWWGKKERVDKATGEITEYMAGSVRRLKTIYATNLQTAYMAGRYKGQMDAAEDLPYIQYISVIDGRTTDRCRDMHGRVFRADDPIWNTLYPPNHWGCRARTRSLTEKAVQREGLRVESSDGRIVTQEVTVGKGANAVKKTVTGLKLANGETFWAGPGWDHNPAQTAWMPDVEKYHPLDARRFVEEGFKGPDYLRFLEAKGVIGGRIPVAVLPKEYMDIIGAKTNVVWLSADSLFKNVAHHPGVKIEDYLRIQQVVEGAKIVAQSIERGEILTFLEVEGKRYTAVMKSTASGENLFLLSYRPSSKGELAKIRRQTDKWKIIKE